MADFKLTERNKEWAILSVVAVVCVVIAFSVLIKPAVGELQMLNTELRSSQKTLGLHQIMEELSSKIREMENNFATLTDRPVILAEVSDLASKEKVNLQSIAPQIQTAGQYTRLSIAMDFTCSFFQLVKYLKAIEDVSPVLNVSEISVLGSKPATGRGQPREVQSKLVLETLLLQKSVKP